jgi:hypothetical protein
MINATTPSARTDLMSRAFEIWRMLPVNMMFGFFINYFSFLVLAFFDSSLLRSHFWPFTPVLRRILRFVTRKVGFAALYRIHRLLKWRDRGWRGCHNGFLGGV